MAQPLRPSYDLESILELVGFEWFEITSEVEKGFDDLNCSVDDMVECILNLTRANFYKSMAAEKRLELLQDVYRSELQGIPVYIKLQLIGSTDKKRYPQQRYVQVISFKRK